MNVISSLWFRSQIICDFRNTRQTCSRNVQPLPVAYKYVHFLLVRPSDSIYQLD